MKDDQIALLKDALGICLKLASEQRFRAMALEGYSPDDGPGRGEREAARTVEIISQALAAIAAQPPQEPTLRESLSDFEIDSIAETMPGGLDGFLKSWGWRQYARAIEAAVHGDAAIEGASK